ncbi:MAG: DUF58 domain-containing protein [Eubacterium sp.]|nr:DUF58 domain-containing protein [Eubacterium sp.]
MKKYRIIYLIIFIICTVLLFAYKSKLTTVLFLFTLFLPALSFILAFITKLLLKVSVIYKTNTVKKNEPTLITVKLTNRFIMPVSPGGMLCTMPFKPKNTFEYLNILMTVPPCSSVTVNFTSPIKLRGVYPAGVEKMIIYDFLKIFALKKKVNRIEDFTVLPRKLLIEPILSDDENDSETASVNRFALIKNTFVNVRDYQPEDSVKHIHWKMSAKLDKLMVKQYERSAGGTSIILADMNGYFPFEEDNAEAADCIMEIMLALNFSLIGEKRSCLNLWYSSVNKSCDSLMVDDEEGYLSLYDIMSALPRQTEIFLPEDTAQSCTEIPSDAGDVYFITSQIRTDFIKKMGEIELFYNKRIKILLINSSMQSEQQEELAETISGLSRTELWKIDKEDIEASLNQEIAQYSK